MTSPRQVQLGLIDPTGAATPVFVNASEVIDAGPAVAVILTRPQFQGAQPPYAPATIRSGATVKFGPQEAAVIVNAGGGTYA